MSNSGSNGNGRSWFEGTLDVISVMAPRSSTPVGNRSNRSMSAPNSPARGNSSGQAGGIARLPSQDSLDRSIHNDSGHGKSTAQIIRDLKHANARLTARTASLEADFMNQLNQTTLRFQEKEKTLEDGLKQKEKHVVTLESRCKIAETRIREKEEGLGKLKEESAFQRHSISDLKTQLHQLSQEETDYGQQRDGAGENWNLEKQDLVRELELLGKDLACEEQEKIVLQQEIDKLRKVATGQASPDRAARSLPDPDESPGSSWKQLEKAKTTLTRTESALTALQGEQQRLAAEHAKRVVALKEELKTSNVDWQQKEGDLLSKIDGLEQNRVEGDLQSQLAERDTAIAKLREQVLDYSGQLTELTEKLTKTKASSDSQEQYRRDEADDLRVLNDAQEEEMDALQKQLEVAVAEIEMREQELEEARGGGSKSVASIDLDDTAPGENNEMVTKLASLQRALGDNKKERDVNIAALQQQLDAAIDEKNSLLARLEAQAVQWGRDAETCESLKIACAAAAQQLQDARVALEAVNAEKISLTAQHRHEISTLQSDKDATVIGYESQLATKEKELAISQQASSTGESTADSARVNALMSEVVALKDQLKQPLSPKTTDQSGGSLEEDLRKKIQTEKLAAKRVAAELNAVLGEKDTELVEIREKLEDRDTTISALVKSSVSLEQQISSSNADVEGLRARLSAVGGEEGIDIVLDGKLDSELTSEVEQLRAELTEAKKSGERLSQDVFRLKRQAHRSRAQLHEDKAKSKSVNSSPRSLVGDDAESDIGPSQRELQERDDAISNLVNQSMAKERQLAELQTKLSLLSNEMAAARSNSKEGSLSREEVKQLRQEAELFAGQVLEQDEEIETLKNALQARDTRVVELLKETNELKSKPAPSKVDSARLMDLEAEIDELKEANSVQRDELRLLRRTTRSQETLQDRIAEAENEELRAKKEAEESKATVEDLKFEKTSLLKELEAVRSRKSEGDSDAHEALEALQESSTKRVAELEAALKEKELAFETAQRTIPVSTSNVDEMEVEALKEEKKALERNLSSQSAAVDSARNTIRELEQMLAEKTAEEAGAHEEEKEELLGEIESLSTEVDNLKEELASMEQERGLIQDFKDKLENADEAREVSEKLIVDTFERKISLLNLDKDVTIDKLRKELVEEKEDNAEEQELMSNRIQEYEMQMSELKEETLAQLEQRDTKIYALEHTLHAQEQLVENMRSEMDHLQGSMQTTAVGRREEIEDMQQELVDLTQRAAAQEREITSLRMQLEEKNLEHKAEVVKLEENVSSLEGSQDASAHRSAMELQMDIRVREVKDRLEKLRWRNESLQEENAALRAQLDKAQNENAKTDDNESSDLWEDLKSQKMRVRELETELKIAVASAPAPAPRPPVAPTSPAAAASPARARGSSSKRSVSGSSPRRLGFLGRRRANSQDTDPVDSPTK